MAEWLYSMHPPQLPAVHEQFLALSQIACDRFAASLGGKLLLRAPFDEEGVAVVVAASIAGAASLSAGADSDRLREALRGGWVDFVVATLDEALRILKNEVRRARPVSVGLCDHPEADLAAMIDRGLQPDLLSGVPHREADLFTQRGAIRLPPRSTPESGTSLLEWSVETAPFSGMQSIADLASASLDPARNDTPARHRWLKQSPRYLGRAFAMRQCLRMTAAEAAGFLPRLRAEFPAAHLTLDGAPL